MDKQIFIKVVDCNNKEFKVSPEQIRIGNKTLKEILNDLSVCKDDITALKEENKKKDKALQELSDKVSQAVSFSMES